MNEDFERRETHPRNVDEGRSKLKESSSEGRRRGIREEGREVVRRGETRRVGGEREKKMDLSPTE